MFAKLLAIVLTALLTAAGLLALRQERLECAHRAADLQRATQARREALWSARQEAVAAARIEAIRMAMEASGRRWVTIVPPALPPSEPDLRLVDARVPRSGDGG